MSPQQKEWTDKQKSLIIGSIEKVGPLLMTDEQWGVVNQRIDKVVGLVHDEALKKEVREALFDAIEPYDKMVNEQIKVFEPDLH